MKAWNTFNNSLRMLFIMAFIGIISLSISAKSELQPKMYAFGFAMSLTDSTVYITNITQVDSVWTDSRTGFVLNRNDYTDQLANCLAVGDLTTTMTVITFAKKEKSAIKKLEGIKKRYSNSKKYNYRIVNIEGFILESVKPQNIELERKKIVYKASKNK